MSNQPFLQHEFAVLRDVSGVKLGLAPEEDPYWLCLVMLYVLADSLMNDFSAARNAEDPEAFVRELRKSSYQEYFDKILGLLPAYIDVNAYREKTGREFFVSTPLVELIMDFYCLRRLHQQLSYLGESMPLKIEFCHFFLGMRQFY